MPTRLPQKYVRAQKSVIARKLVPRLGRGPDVRELRFEALECRLLLVADFGDAPLPYPTTIGEGGAQHTIAGPQLGATRTATVDGNHLNNDADDDGVTIGTLQVGQLNASLTVNVVGAPSGARIDAWIDFNGDGAWGGPMEQIADNVAVVNGNNALLFDIPTWAEPGTTYAEIRISTAGNLGVGGLAATGEVEDYAVTISPPTLATGVFGAQNVISTQADMVNSVFAADIDGDGDYDVLSASFNDDEISWFENNGSGAFTSHLISQGPPDGAKAVFAGDFDGDSDLDVFSTSYNDDEIAVYVNDGTPAVGTWTRTILANDADGARSIFLSDLDRDGDLDVLYASFLDDTLAWYENGTGVNHIINTPDPDNNPTNATNGDINGPTAVYAADIDGDGWLDVVTSSSLFGGLVWFENLGTPATAWGRHTIKNSDVSPTIPEELSLVAADIDGDGLMDVVSANYSEGRIAWYENDGTPASGIWSGHDISTSALGAYSVFAADVDGDGEMDVVSASLLDDKVVWYENIGSGSSFTPHTITSSGNANGAISVFAADLNGDRALDVISGSTLDDKVAWYKNPATPAFFVTQSNGTTQVSESGTTDTFSIVLNAQPSSNVVLNISSSDTGEATVSVPALTFTTANWNVAQTITVTGVNDFIIDGTQVSMITISVNDASSDNNYDPLPNQVVSVSTTDNDTAGFTVTQTGGNTQVSEPNTTDTFTVVLNAQPNSTVQFNVTSSDTGEAIVSPGVLSFTPANWNMPQTVTVTGVNDFIIDGTQTSTITISVVDANSDNNFDPLPDQFVSVTTTDNDSAGFTVAQTGGTTQVSENLTTDTFTVVLNAQPNSNVVLSVSSGDTGEATVSAPSLTFTTANWSLPQTITVTGVNDFLVDGTQTSTITIAVNDASSDNNFDPLSDQFVSVTTTDNDSAALPGDYDHDSDVDTADYTIWKANFGSTTNLNADGNGNGIVDAADYALWRNNKTSTASASGAVVIVDAFPTAEVSTPAVVENAVMVEVVSPAQHVVVGSAAVRPLFEDARIQAVDQVLLMLPRIASLLNPPVATIARLPHVVSAIADARRANTVFAFPDFNRDSVRRAQSLSRSNDARRIERLMELQIAANAAAIDAAWEAGESERLVRQADARNFESIGKCSGASSDLLAAFWLDGNQL